MHSIHTAPDMKKIIVALTFLWIDQMTVLWSTQTVVNRVLFVSLFNVSVPFLYPIEIFERVWAVDRLERLGISYYFKTEIDEYCLEYTFRWSFDHIVYQNTYFDLSN